VKPVAVYVDSVEANLHGGPERLHDAGFDVRVAVATTPAGVGEVAAGATALLVGDAPVDATVLDAAPSVRIVSTVTAGTDHIDLGAARERGVWVCNVPDASTEEVAVHALAMALALVRRLPAFDREVRAGGWFSEGRRLRRASRLTLGIVGLGRIGAELGRLAGPVFGRVIGSDPAMDGSEAASGIPLLNLDRLLAEADVVSLHVPLTPSTRGLIDARRMALMRPGAVLVNVARGGLVDQDALCRALDEGRLAGAGLDVFAEEPPPDGPLRRHEAVLLSPHVAYLSDEADRDLTAGQVENVVAWASGARPRSVVVEGRR